MPAFEPTVLADNHVRLEPLHMEHVPALQAAAADGELWTLWYTSVPAPQDTADYVRAALDGQAAGHMLAYAVRDLHSGDIVGSTRYCHIDAALPRLEIGYTWYAARCQRSHVNTACKRLLLAHAFEVLGCVAVEFCTDRYNQRSQQAIARLGATRDGMLRAHRRRADGSLRDTVVFSILAAEWPDVARLLALRLQRLAA